MEIRRYSYVERGFYAEQLIPWFEHFSQNSILALTSDDLYSNPTLTFSSVTSFLGLSDWKPGKFENHTYVGRKRGASIDAFPVALRRSLLDTFAEPNRRLEELLGRDLAWSRPSSIDSESLA
jgi:hypothetical protein